MPITVRIQTDQPHHAHIFGYARSALRLAANGRSIEGSSPVEAFMVA